MTRRLEMKVRREGERLVLCSPVVGVFTCAEAPGRMLAPGEAAGVLHVLGVAHELVVPPGGAGRIASACPERVHEPVGHGDALYELAALDAATASAAAKGPEEDTPESPGSVESPGGLFLRAPHAGRFWHHPTPGAEPFVAAGDEVSAGRPVGLIEVMKTFTHVHYEAGGELPTRARVVRIVAADGAEVGQDDPLLELEAI